MSAFAPDKIMVALDVDTLDEARAIAEQLAGTGVTFKIGNQLGTYAGWEACVALAREFGASIFCDTKFKDIPATVGKSARAITRHQPDVFNIMADTQPEAMQAAVEGVESAVRDYGVQRPLIIGVTVLTSYSDEDAMSVYGAPSRDKVLQFATRAAANGLDGVVCSAEEAAMLRAHDETKSLTLITPGIRPLWAASGDQSRVMTPRRAIEAGADYLVIGRPITQPPPEIGSPQSALEKILEEIGDL